MKKLYKKMRALPLCMLAIALLLSPAVLKAQSAQTATGTVVDVDGNPIVGVAVVHGSQGAITDGQGNFQLNNVPVGATLSFQFMGLVTVEKKFEGQPLHVVMEDDAIGMDEVIVVAYGEQKRSAFTGSAAVVSSDQIALRPVTNVMSALEGAAPGVQIQSTSGAPTSTPTFRIRGASSINAGRDPLIVLDGVPFEAGSWNDINPADVESVTVLKDAASTAIYGARGGNGVILVTTKKASRAEKVVVKFDAKFGISKYRKSDLYEVIEDPGEYYEQHYGAMFNYWTNVRGLSAYEANQTVNSNWRAGSEVGGLGYMVYDVPENQTLIGHNGKLNPEATLGYVVDGKNGEQYLLRPDDWKKAALKTGFRQDYNLSLNGGTEKLTLLTSAGYTKDEGITDASYYERFTGRIKGSFNAKKWLRLSASLDLSVSESGLNTDYDNNSNNIFSNAMRVAPIYPMYIRDVNGDYLYDENGKVYDYGDGTYNNGLTRPVSTNSNRVQEALIQTRERHDVKTGAQAAADFIIMPGLTVTANVAFDERDRRYKTTSQPFYGSSNPGGSLYVYHYKWQTVNLQQLVNYSKSFGEHHFKATLLHEWYKYNYYNLYASRANMFSYFENQELSGAVTLNSGNSYSREYQSEGYGGRVLYDYKGVYHFDASYRRDASSRFHPDNRWGNFYSFGAGYLISREDFFNVPWVDMLKIKFSVGQNGNDQVGNTYNRYEDIYEISPADGEIALTFYSRGNKNITWETRTAINAGIEFELFKGRLSGGIDYYNNKTTDMLAQVSVPTSLGYSYLYDNVGSMRNQGVEIDLRGDIIRKKDFRWSMYVNASYNKSKILKLAETRRGESLYNLDGSLSANGYTSSNGRYFYGEGLEYRTWHLKKFAGINDEGQAMWYVLDEETKELSTTTVHSSATYFNCGSSQPKVLGGFGGSVAWKSLELSFSFAYRLGGYAYDSGYASLMSVPYNGHTGYNYHKDTKKYWTAENPRDDLPIWQFDDRYFTSASDRWLTKANYLSLQNVTLGYTLPKNLTQRFGVDRVVVSAGVDDVFLLSRRKGFNPTRSFDGGLDLGYYPAITRFLFNLSFTF